MAPDTAASATSAPGTNAPATPAPATDASATLAPGWSTPAPLAVIGMETGTPVPANGPFGAKSPATDEEGNGSVFPWWVVVVVLLGSCGAVAAALAVRRYKREAESVDAVEILAAMEASSDAFLPHQTNSLAAQPLAHPPRLSPMHGYEAPSAGTPMSFGSDPVNHVPRSNPFAIHSPAPRMNDCTGQSFHI
eukprot:TRINITY_DN6086_c0_g1_i1.p1 TRINITY_DN6086_c0_g1~~TRINITY_DN6086_c0_g1_i1.p1  ORF type:complete len:203 (+),score=26.97 TRINITY_DN6086_c0_g1_i1:36-611(+)